LRPSTGSEAPAAVRAYSPGTNVLHLQIERDLAPELERQCCRFSPAGYVGAGSPDCADAAIWALTELMLDHEPQPNIRFFDIPNLPAY